MKTFKKFILMYNENPLHHFHYDNLNNLIDTMKLLCYIKIETMKFNYKRNFTFDDILDHLEQQYLQKYKYTVYV